MSIPAARLSASQAYRLAVEVVAFDAYCDTPLDAAQWYDGSAGGGGVTRNATISAYEVAASGANGARGLLRSHARPKAAAGRARSVVIVGHVSDDEVAYQKKRWGLFDDNNGHFFELDGEELYVVIRSNTSGSVVDQRIARGAWSYRGKPKTTDVDTTLTHEWEIRETWPNGIVTFFVDGSPVYEHSSAGAIVGPVSRTSRLPVSIETVNSAATSAAHFSLLSAIVVVELAPVPGRTFSVTDSAAGVTTSDTPLLALRPAATFGGAANLAELLVDTITATCTDLTTFKIWLGATITGGAWSAPDATSAAEVNTTAASIAGGTAIAFEAESALALSDAREILRTLRLLGDGVTPDTLVITAAAAAGTVSARVALSWKEVR